MDSYLKQLQDLELLDMYIKMAKGRIDFRLKYKDVWGGRYTGKSGS